jgi:prepilin-type N-terminal cleavage/methylation domain-containing protein
MHIKRGFTLIELMVASSIFIIVMVVAIGAVLSIVDANRKAQSINSVMTNLNFAVETMVREINTGYDLCAPSGCRTDTAVTSSELSFINGAGQNVTYRLVNNQIAKSVNGNGVFNTDIPITAPEVNITGMQFYVQGHGSSDGMQPIVLLLIQGTAGASAKSQSTFRIETLTAQRRLDS